MRVLSVWQLLATAAVVGAVAHPQEKTRRAVDTSTLKGKWLYGYQGWFRKPASGVNNHWSPNGGTPGPGNVEVEFLPDVSQYPAACLFSSGFILPNGKAAQLYDNTCEGVVDLHFQWMQQAGVDGVVVQRFLSALNDATFTTVLNQVQAAAEKYGLGFLVEYDVSGANSVSGGAATEVLADYNNKIKAYTTSSAYIHQNGKPVVMAFGFASTALGFGPTPADGLNMLNGFKAAGAYIGVGPPTTWSNEISGNTAWAPVLKAANLISPWTVGSYSNGGYQAGYFTQIQKPDVALCASLGIDYAPVIWPGTSADHLNGGSVPANLDYFPRFNGTFYEKQAANMVALDPMFVFNAMFDEMNEGTQSLPCLKINQLPTDEPFVGYDNDFPDTSFYLKTGGTYAAQLHAKQ